MIVLVGFMGAGKTTVGHIVAERLGMPFVDSDLVIEQRLGRSIRDIFATEGEIWFRELEREVVDELIRGPAAILALGGGALGDARTRAVLRNSHVVYLDVELAEAMDRVRHDEYRPLPAGWSGGACSPTSIGWSCPPCAPERPVVLMGCCTG